MADVTVALATSGKQQEQTDKLISIDGKLPALVGGKLPVDAAVDVSELAKDATVAKDASVQAVVGQLTTAVADLASILTALQTNVPVTVSNANGDPATGTRQTAGNNSLSSIASLLNGTLAVELSTATKTQLAPYVNQKVSALDGSDLAKDATLLSRLPVDATTSRLAVALPPGGGGLTNTELRATALPTTYPATRTYSGTLGSANGSVIGPFACDGVTTLRISSNTSSNNYQWYVGVSYDGVNYAAGLRMLNSNTPVGGGTLTYDGSATMNYANYIADVSGAVSFKLFRYGNDSSSTVFSTLAVFGAVPPFGPNIPSGLSPTDPLLPVLGRVTVANSSLNTAISGTPNFNHASVSSSRNTATSTPLAAGGVYTSSAISVGGYRKIEFVVNSDQAGTCVIQISPDASSWFNLSNAALPVAADSAGALVYASDAVDSYFRIVYTNGATNQGRFRIRYTLLAV